MGKTTDLVEIVYKIKKDWKICLYIIGVAVIFSVLVTLVYPKTYRSESLIQLGSIDGLIYEETEVKNIIDSSDILLPIKDSYYGDSLSFDDFREKNLKVELVIEKISLTENEQVQQIRIITFAETSERAVNINKDILENLLEYVGPVFGRILAVKNNELVQVNNDIKRLEEEIEEASSDINFLKNQAGFQEISRVLILREVISNLESSLDEKQNKKYLVENILANTKEFKVISYPQPSQSPVSPKIWLNMGIFFVVGLLTSILVVVSRSK